MSPQLKMTDQEILEAVGHGESADWEFKSARGGLPKTLWETYSAMANTDGGIIVLGVEERDRSFTVSGLPDAEKSLRDFWNTINDRGKVSANLLSDSSISVLQVTAQDVLAIQVPRASRRQRPLYVGLNPLTGTYRRNNDGDFRCTAEEVGRMLADRAVEPADSRILAGFGLDDLDTPSLQQYRNRFSARDPEHPWLALDTQELLVKLGGWRRDRISGEEGLTIAGLLMFGKDSAIRDPAAIPGFNVDYREKRSEDLERRWDDRLTENGRWEANLFQFYQHVIQRLTHDLQVPFALTPELLRRDDTPVHAGIREATVNALIHADYQGQGGIVIERTVRLIELSNPGILLVSREQIARGGISECRNTSLQQMFQMVGAGEKAGSGWDRISSAWRQRKWLAPAIEETVKPDRVVVTLPMVSLLPANTVQRLSEALGGAWESLGLLERQVLATADVEGSVSNARVQMITGDHPADITRILQGLAAKGLLRQTGHKKGTRYKLAAEQARDRASGSANLRSYSTNSEELPDQGMQEWNRLQAIAAPVSSSRYTKHEVTRQTVQQLLNGRFLTLANLAALLRRNPNGLRNQFLAQMVRDGVIRLKYPHEPNHPNQAYTATGNDNG